MWWLSKHRARNQLCQPPVFTTQHYRVAGELDYDSLTLVRSLVATIRSRNSCTVPVFYQTWGRLNGDTSNCQYYSKLCTFDGMQVTYKQNWALWHLF